MSSTTDLRPETRSFLASLRSRAYDLEAVAADLNAAGILSYEVRSRVNELRRTADEFEAAEIALLDSSGPSARQSSIAQSPERQS